MILGEKENKSSDKPSQKKEDQLAHLNLDIAPGSPAAQTSSETGATGGLMRENSLASVSSMSNLPPDTQKFLKFAGKDYSRNNCMGGRKAVKLKFYPWWVFLVSSLMCYIMSDLIKMDAWWVQK